MNQAGGAASFPGSWLHGSRLPSQQRFGQMPLVFRWPNLGANLNRDSVVAKMPAIEFVRDHFAVSEAITYYEFTLETAIAQGV